MPIVASDLVYRYSAADGTSGNSHAGAITDTLGKFMSTTAITDDVTDNFFPDITGDENAAENVDYCCVFIHNTNSTLTLRSAVVWLANQVSGGANIAIATDNIGVTPASSSTQQAAVITSKNTAPTGVSAFSAPTSKSTGLPLGNIPAGSCAAVWIRRTATDSPAQTGDGFTLQVSGDTDA